MPAQSIRESIKIASNIKNISVVSSRIIELLKARDVDKSIIFDIRLSVEETVINAIEHGNKNNEKKKVTVSFLIDEEKFDAEIEDEGEGFEQVELQDPTIGKNMLRSHGRGVYLVHRLMDTVEYNKKGNKVKLVKRLR